MEEGEPPSSIPTSPVHTVPTQRKPFDPFILLNKAITYGEAVWSHIQVKNLSHTTPLLNLSYIIEDHLQNLIELCSTAANLHLHKNDSILTSLTAFYSAPILSVTRNHFHSTPLVFSILENPNPSRTSSKNYFSPLQLFNMDSPDPDQPMTHTSPVVNPQMSQPSKSFFVEDLALEEIGDIVKQQIGQDKEQLETIAVTGDGPIQQTQDIPISQRLRINLIRHRFARSSDMTVLKLFKSFISSLRASDKELTILPFDSKKQQYTSIVSNRQIDQLNDHEVKLYFQPWHKEQHYSLSGFFHLSSKLPFDELFAQAPIAQWLDTYQYSVKLCPSQTEEMTVIGALCYGSLWIYREDLKLHITQHTAWKQADTDPDNPIIFDLIVRQFRGTKKSTQMIFVTTERSKQDIVREIFKTIYDGSPKVYPRGEMLLFIPTRNGEQYSNEQRDKFIYNHEAYLGDEEISAIHGLRDLNTQITLKGGKSTTLRTLLKSLPATAGMSRKFLFHIVDPNAGQTCTIVSFQKCDRMYIEQRKINLENEIRAVLEQGECNKVFLNNEEGIWFGGHVRKKNGKPIALSVPHKADLEYIQLAESRLKSPQEKRDFISSNATNPKPSRPPTQITYSGIMQARTQTTQSVSIQDTEGTTTTTTTQTSQMVTALMEARFQGLETEMKTQKEHQRGMDQRLSHLENRTTTINDNIAAMMEHWQINPSQKRRAISVAHNQNQTLSTYTDQERSQSPDTSSVNMGNGDMEEW